MKKQRQEVNVVSKTSTKYEGTKLCMYISQYSSVYEHVSMVYSGIWQCLVLSACPFKINQ